jgi:NTE family protein
MNTDGSASQNPDLWRITANDKLGLALSGGGFRASLFHIGVLARMAELDLLRHVSVLSTVSGGSIIGAYYYLKVKNLLEGRGHRRNPNAAPSRQAYVNIVEEIEEDFLRAVQTNIRMQLLLDPVKNARMLLSDDYSRSDRMAELYNEHFYEPLTRSLGIQNIKLSDLKITPHAIISKAEADNFDAGKYNRDSRYGHKIPILTINATSLNTGHRWQFTSSWVGESPLPGCSIDTNVTLKLLRLDGIYPAPLDSKWQPPAPSNELENLRQRKLKDLNLSDAVAASACVPGIFTPLSIHDLYWNSRKEEIVVELVDGGVFDNQGLDALFAADCTHIICSDASGQLEDSRTPSSQILSVVGRTNDILMTRVRAECLEKLQAGKAHFAFFHLRDAFEGNHEYPSIPGPADRSDNKTDGHIYRLSNLRTDLDTFTDMEAFTLMYDGYCLSDSRLVTRSSALNLGTPVEIPGAGRWRFLAIRKIISCSPLKLLEQLHVGANRSFKVFRLAPILSLLCAAAIAVPFLIDLYLWRRDIQIDLILTFIAKAAVFVIVAGAIFWPLKKLENTKYIMRILDTLRGYRRGNVLGLVFPFAAVGAIGAVIACVHLFIFDPLFKKAGKV